MFYTQIVFISCIYDHIDPFCFFLLQRDYGTFHVLLFEAFDVFLVIVICRFYA